MIDSFVEEWSQGPSLGMRMGDGDRKDVSRVHHQARFSWANRRSPRSPSGRHSVSMWQSYNREAEEAVFTHQLSTIISRKAIPREINSTFPAGPANSPTRLYGQKRPLSSHRGCPGTAPGKIGDVDRGCQRYLVGTALLAFGGLVSLPC